MVFLLCLSSSMTFKVSFLCVTISSDMPFCNVSSSRSSDTNLSCSSNFPLSNLASSNAKIAEETARQLGAPQSVGPAHATDQTSLAGRHPTPWVRPISHTGRIGPRAPRRWRTFKPKSPKKARWKKDERRSQYKKFRIKPIFDFLLDKYTHQTTVSRDQPREKRSRSPPR
jgi:hypothetical protein